MTEIHIIPTLEDNYTYAVQVGGKVILIDCGEAQPVLDFLQNGNLVPIALLCTHHHGDHIAGIADIKKSYPAMTVYAPAKDMPRIADAQTGLDDEQVLIVNSFEIQCLETPGHTLNHLCFYFPGLEAVFTGDTLFSLGCGRLFEGTPQDLFTSLQKLKNLPDKTRIYCGHEYTEKNAQFSLNIEPDNLSLQNKWQNIIELRKAGKPTLPVILAEEKQNNLFLRADTVEKIAQLRQLRDKF